MRVLVTGGAGYLGSTLVPILLDGGHHVKVLDSLEHGGASLLPVWSHPSFEFCRVDIRETDAVKAALSGVEAVVHLAAIVGDPACAREPDRARLVNLKASLALLEESRRAGARRFLFASTCSNYGKMADSSQFVDEESELRPVSLYAETKVAVEKALLATANGGEWAPTSLRFATIFGVSPRMRFDLTVNEFTLEMLRKKKLSVFGEQFWRPYVHVCDAARAIRLALESPIARISGRVFNVGATNQNFQKRQLIDLIRPHASNATVEFIHKTEDPRDYRVSFDRIKDELGFCITRTVSDGIAEVAHLVQSNVLTDFESPHYRN
jgi:nucleoside-diphosphate-sugar epimerase